MIALAISLAAMPLASSDKTNLSLIGFMCSVEGAAPKDLFFFSVRGREAANQVRIEPLRAERAFLWPKEKLLILNSLHGIGSKQTDAAVIGMWEVSKVPGVESRKVSFSITFPRQLADGSQARPTAEFSAIIGARPMKAHCDFVPLAPSSQESK